MGGMGSGHSHRRRQPADGPSSALPGKPGENWEVITEMTQCVKPVRVRKGDKLHMVSYYDGDKHPPRPTMNSQGHKMEADEMGVFFINFAVSNKTEEQLLVKGTRKADGVFLLDAA
jgi:hypothetical protein